MTHSSPNRNTNTEIRLEFGECYDGQKQSEVYSHCGNKVT